jgi:hypothetical protein
MVREQMYSSIIEKIFQSKYKPGLRRIAFGREELVTFGNELKIKIPKNLGDVVYSFRYRKAFPSSILATAGEGECWIIRPAGKGKYVFDLIADIPIVPMENMLTTKIPDSTPGLVTKYAFIDEQALLAKIRYNRMIDIFLGITCYSLQNHLRTTVKGMGQVETDEIYVGIDKRGMHYVVPIQAKSGTDKLNVVQIEQDFGVCAQRFPLLTCRPVAAQFMNSNVIVLFEFGQDDQKVGVLSEKHYKLVPQSNVTKSDLDAYRKNLEG